MSQLESIKERFEKHCLRPLPTAEMLEQIDARVRELQTKFLASQIESLTLEQLVALRVEAINGLEPLSTKRRKAV